MPSAHPAFVHWNADGRIEAILHYQPGAPVAALSAQYGGRIMPMPPGTAPETHYVKDGAIAPRRPLGASWSREEVVADGVDEAVLSPLPIPCTVHVDGRPVDVDDGSFELACSEAGEYHVAVDEPGWLMQEWTITASIPED